MRGKSIFYVYRDLLHSGAEGYKPSSLPVAELIAGSRKLRISLVPLLVIQEASEDGSYAWGIPRAHQAFSTAVTSLPTGEEASPCSISLSSGHPVAELLIAEMPLSYQVPLCT